MEEKTFLVKITEGQMKALEQFIGRVNLNAKEVQAFTALMAVFAAATPMVVGGGVGRGPDTEAVEGEQSYGDIN